MNCRLQCRRVNSLLLHAQPTFTPMTAQPLLLLVEDFPDAREMYQFYLARRGYRVEVAAEGHEALRLAMELHPSLILMDLGLPGIDGWTLIRMLKQDDGTRSIPILVLSGYTTSSARERAFAAGCNGYLTKPCLPARLAEEIDRAMGQGPRC